MKEQAAFIISAWLQIILVDTWICIYYAALHVLQEVLSTWQLGHSYPFP